MKSTRFIRSLLSVLLVLVFIAGSTGFTLIIHTCTVCNQNTIMAGIFLSPSEPEDHCCDAADAHSSANNGISLQSSCCHFKIEKLKLNNYSPAVQLLVSTPAGTQVNTDLLAYYPVNERLTHPFELHNKHGGRDLLKLNCQLQS